jgi:predicted DNA-binding helix-hairpin-helix protein
MREFRLYQVDYLYSRYGFTPNDLCYEESGNLNIDKDPKYVYAQHHPEIYPMEINTASLENLLLVPGIGPVSAKRITKSRKAQPYHSAVELKGTGAVIKRALPFITINGRTPESHQPEQLSFLTDAR